MTTPLQRLTLWPEAFPANPSATLASDEARQMTVTSGRLLLPLLRDDGPLGCFSRMLLGSSTWHSIWCRLTWKAQATPAKRTYFRLAPSARHTSANASSLWPTPKAQSGNGAGLHGQGGMDLQTAVQKWPTPTALDSGSGRLNTSKGRGAKERPTLALMARKGLWPTPTQRDYKSGTGVQSRPGHPPPLTDVVQGTLNPEWIEALMGFPVGWTALDGQPCQDTPSTSGNLHARSRHQRELTEQRVSKR